MQLDVPSSTKLVDYGAVRDVDGTAYVSELVSPITTAKGYRPETYVLLLEFDGEVPITPAHRAGRLCEVDLRGAQQRSGIPRTKRGQLFNLIDRANRELR